MLASNKKLNVSIELLDFSQAQYEIYQSEIFRETDGGNMDTTTTARASGAVVRAAIKAGFLIGYTAEQVGSLSPAVVKWMTQKVHQHVTEITTVPPDDPN